MEKFKHFEFSISDPDETDLVLVSVTDTRTNFTVRSALPNHGKQTASIMAFAGARYSRSSLTASDLLKEIKNSGKNANEKLANIFKNYGHASVADMAMLFVYIENVPDIYAIKFMYETSLGGGQQRSTRYQDFSKSKPVSLGDYMLDKSDGDYEKINYKFQALQNKSLNYYRKYIDILTKKYTEVYKIDESNKAEINALQARVFDSARYFLLSGTYLKTSFAWINSAREWARLISLFKSSVDERLNYLAELMEIIFAPDEKFAKKIGYIPEAPDLIRHTTKDETTADNLENLEEILEKNFNFSQIMELNEVFGFHETEVLMLKNNISVGVKTLMQNIITIYPSISETWLINWLESLSNKDKELLSKVIFDKFDHHSQMGSQFRLNSLSFLLKMSISEMRDLNRHRAWGRFVPLLSAEKNLDKLLDEGYTLPAYLTENSELSKERENFENDLLDYYKELSEFLELIKNKNWFP